MNDRATLWVRSGLVWLFLTMLAGFHIGITGQFGAASHHAHMGLLGGLWSIAFAWLFERKGSVLTTAAKVQWALYNAGLVTMATAMFLIVRVGGMWGPILGLGAIVLLGSGLWIIVQLWPRRAG